MKFYVTVVAIALLCLSQVGCNASPKPSGQEQKKVLQLYMEGLRDQDFSKLQRSTNPRVFAGWPQEPEKLRAYLIKQQKDSTGNFKTWEFEKTPFIDLINGQTIIRTNLVTDKYRFTMDYDLRKQDDVWGIYGVKTVNQVNLQKKSGNTQQQLTRELNRR